MTSLSRPERLHLGIPNWQMSCQWMGSHHCLRFCAPTLKSRLHRQHQKVAWCQQAWLVLNKDGRDGFFFHDFSWSFCWVEGGKQHIITYRTILIHIWYMRMIYTATAVFLVGWSLPPFTRSRTEGIDQSITVTVAGRTLGGGSGCSSSHEGSTNGLKASLVVRGGMVPTAAIKSSWNTTRNTVS